MSFLDLPPKPVELDDTAKPDTREYEILEWCEDRLKRGQKFIESQIGYDKISEATDYIFSYERSSTGSSYIPPMASSGLSKTQANIVAKIAEDLTAMLTDMELFWRSSTRNPKYEHQSRLLNKEAEDWYAKRQIGLRIADVVRHYIVGGTGYAHLYYSRRLNDQIIEAEDPRDVYPVDPISYHTLQDALGVIIRRARTPRWVLQEFGKKVDPDTGSLFHGWLTRILHSTNNRRSGPLSRRNVVDSPEEIPGTPTVYVNTMYLKDSRVNETKSIRYMGKWTDGKPATQWSYKVPPGAPLYPFGRMISWTKGRVCYDDTSPFWHGKFPLIKLTLNPWPKAFLGKAPLWDIVPLNQSLNSLLRIIDDHAAQLAQPGVVADRNVSKAELNKFNSRVAGYQIRTNMSTGKGIQVQTPPALDPSLWEHVKWIETTMRLLSGVMDVSQMANLAQVPSDDTIEAIMKAMTPAVRLRSRILEGFMTELAEQYAYNVAEFDTMASRISRFGPSAVTREDFDYDPGTFIPDDVPDGDPGDIGSTQDALGLSEPRPLYKRAEQMLRAFSFAFKPGSLLNSAAQMDRMIDLLLSKMGYLSVFTLMESFGRTNFVPPSIQVPSSELERLQLQNELGIGMMANAQGRKATNQEPPKASDAGAGDATIQTS